ncbi:hypothetical protein [uncultured Dokdonia sp.]|uniref:hypothetical protein n=1 Tax=uncultured Dokdonia sp. TaxID=575653 RepID=UPI0026037666|nr:hypothetical protein [uncultured Dokdonia sp.]
MNKNISHNSFANTETGAYTILIGLIIIFSFIFYFNWFNDLNNRNKELDQIKSKQKAVILNVENLQELSMHMDGNTILEVGREFNYKYLSDSLSAIITERVHKTQIDVKYWRSLYDIKINDTIDIGISKSGRPLILIGD